MTTTVRVGVSQTDIPCSRCGGQADNRFYVVSIGAFDDSFACCTTCATSMSFIIEAAPEEQLGMRERKKLSKAGEKSTAKRLGGQPTKASGSLPWDKGDVNIPGVALVEEKFTLAGSYRLHLADLQKLIAETPLDAFSLFVVKFVDKIRKVETGAWGLLPLKDIQTLLKEYHREKRTGNATRPHKK